jgi:hypothetical protein
MLTTAEAVPVAAPRSALRRLTIAEAKLFVRERYGIIWGGRIPPRAAHHLRQHPSLPPAK